MDRKEYTEPGACLRCEKMDVRTTESGCEAMCTAKSERGRTVAWKYGLPATVKWCEQDVRFDLGRRIAPAWCPERAKEKGK